jgi:hypothetical protein
MHSPSPLKRHLRSRAIPGVGRPSASEDEVAELEKQPTTAYRYVRHPSVIRAIFHRGTQSQINLI